MSGHLVFGLGGTVDYEIEWDDEKLSELALAFGIRRYEVTTTAPVVDERSLVVTILGFMSAGGGGERFVQSSLTLEQFAGRFKKKVTLGGTGVRAGLALEKLNIPTIQHLVSIDDNVRRLMPSSISWVCSAAADSLDPHLIVQYPVGARVHLADGDLISPASNRLIFANDIPNREMAISSELGDVLDGAAAFVVSGFNTMQNAELLEQRLDELARAMERLPANALVYYEDAGFYRRELAARVRARLLRRIDVYSMNEDELQEYVGRSIDLLDVQDVRAALAEAHALIPAPALVVHTRYWAVAVGPDAGRYREALESAVVMSATRYRLGDSLTALDIEETASLLRHEGGRRVVADLETILPSSVGIAAVAAEVASPTTIGLGDSFVGGFFAGAGRASPDAPQPPPRVRL